jgi:hypothetical protein
VLAEPDQLEDESDAGDRQSGGIPKPFRCSHRFTAAYTRRSLVWVLRYISPRQCRHPVGPRLRTPDVVERYRATAASRGSTPRKAEVTPGSSGFRKVDGLSLIVSIMSVC